MGAWLSTDPRYQVLHPGQFNMKSDLIQYFRTNHITKYTKYKSSNEKWDYPDSVVVVPSNLGWEATQQAVLVAWLKPQHPNININIKISNQLIFNSLNQRKKERKKSDWL